ncbi:hypothetical protein TNCV_3419071 [Trichonephila clavipes]|nr:hypothetical protein TNCV_3419071 [Trichonephila clavipes]
MYACRILSFEHHTGDSTFWLGSIPILRKITLGVVRGIRLSSPFIKLTRGPAARRLLRVPPCRKGTIHLQTSMPSPGFEHRPYGTAVCVANPYGRSFHKVV